MENYYTIRFKCWNCGYKFNREILKGRQAANNAGKCPHCQVESSTTELFKSHVNLGLVTKSNPDKSIMPEFTKSITD